LNKSTDGAVPILLKSTAKQAIQMRTKTGLWNTYFPDVPLSAPRWVERLSHKHLAEALRITRAEDRAGRFPVRDQENIGKYLNGVVRRLKNGGTFDGSGKGVETVTFRVTTAAGYRFTDKDKKRFKALLRPDGDCLRWTGSKTPDGYGRFKVNGKAMSAHYGAFFMEVGCLPGNGELDGKKFNVSHNCRNRDCCNPKHLTMKTKRVNLEEREYST
jgi:Zinc-binding loop region of homing endonuclease